MRSCDDCQGGDSCAGNCLTPVLLRVYDLYAAGRTDKFEILFALDEEDERLLEAHTAKVQRACWTRAALGAIAEALRRRAETAPAGGDWPAMLEQTLRTAARAFERFPWHLPDLVEQAAELHAHVSERIDDDAFAAALTRRSFANACKLVVYGGGR